MKVFDRIKNEELDLSTGELIDLVANHNRQVDLTFTETKTDADGYMSWDAENWTSLDGRKFIRCYSLKGRVLADATHYNIYDMKGYFEPEKADTVTLG